MTYKTTPAEAVVFSVRYNTSGSPPSSVAYSYQMDSNIQFQTRSTFSGTTNSNLNTTALLSGNGLYITSQGAVTTSTGFAYETTAAIGDVANITTCFTQDQTKRWMQLVTYTGNGASSQTVNHNLGTTPAMMVWLPYGTSAAKITYHKNMGANPETKSMLLDTNAAPVVSSTYWNNTAPTSSTFTVGSVPNVNAVQYRMWLIADFPGKVKVGGYTGNGTNQTINTGLSGAVRSLWIKKVNVGSWWCWNGQTGIPSSGNDLCFAIDLTGAWVSGVQSVNSSGNDFIVYENATTAVNTNGEEYIYFAIGT